MLKKTFTYEKKHRNIKTDTEIYLHARIKYSGKKTHSTMGVLFISIQKVVNRSIEALHNAILLRLAARLWLFVLFVATHTARPWRGGLVLVQLPVSAARPRPWTLSFVVNVVVTIVDSRVWLHSFTYTTALSREGMRVSVLEVDAPSRLWRGIWLSCSPWILALCN